MEVLVESRKLKLNMEVEVFGKVKCEKDQEFSFTGCEIILYYTVAESLCLSLISFPMNFN